MQKQQEREEKQHQKDEAAAAKAIRVAETTQWKLNWLAEKERKLNERAAKVAKKAAQNIVHAAGRGHGCGRGRGRGVGQG